MSPLTGDRWLALCDPIWHVSSSSGMATSVSELLYQCVTLLTLLWALDSRLNGCDFASLTPGRRGGG